MTQNYSEKWLKNSIVNYTRKVKETNPNQFQKENLNEFVDGVTFSSDGNNGNILVCNNKSDDEFVIAELNTHGQVQKFADTLPSNIKKLIQEWGSNRAQVKRNLASSYRKMKEES